MQPASPTEHRDMLASYAKRSRLFVAYPAKFGDVVESVIGRPVPLPAGAVWCGRGLGVALWASTAFLQVPQHTVLARGFQARAHRRLVGTNWIRTVLWTARAGLALWMLVRAL